MYTQNKTKKQKFCNILWELEQPRPPVRDSLDLRLLSRYNNACESFPYKTDVVLQPETVKDAKYKKKIIAKIESMKPDYPVLIGGIIEKISPDNVKLMSSGHHSHSTNPGYSRQSGGSFYKY